MQASTKNSISDSEKREKKILEKKLAEMEDELKVRDFFLILLPYYKAELLISIFKELSKTSYIRHTINNRNKILSQGDSSDTILNWSNVTQIFFYLARAVRLDSQISRLLSHSYQYSSNLIMLN